jgi:hypothetical protein
MKKYILILLCLIFPSLVSARVNTVIYSKDLGTGIVMEQTDTQTYIKLRWRVLKSYSNVSKRVPFIWDEGCNAYSKKILDLNLDAFDGTKKQAIWDDLWVKWQQECMREYHRRAISMNKLNETNRFVTILHGWYEGFDASIIDLQSGNIQDIGESDIKKVVTGKSGTYIETDPARWDCHGEIYMVTPVGKFISQFSMCKIAKDNDTAIMNSFELLNNQRLQVTYTLNDTTMTKIYPIKTK